MQASLILIIMAGGLIYTALGIDYIRILRNHNQRFRTVTDEHEILQLLAIATWLPIYIIIKICKAISPLLCCPRCGSGDGFYDISIQRLQFNYKWDGKSDGATEPDEIRGGKRRYCQQYDFDVTKKTKQYGLHET